MADNIRRGLWRVIARKANDALRCILDIEPGDKANNKAMQKIMAGAVDYKAGIHGKMVGSGKRGLGCIVTGEADDEASNEPGWSIMAGALRTRWSWWMRPRAYRGQPGGQKGLPEDRQR